LAIPLAVLLAVLVVVLLASLCRGSARLSLSWFCSPLPARLIPSTVAVPGSPIPSLAVTPAVARSPPRNSPVTRSRTPKPSPVVLLGTHPSPVVLRESCSRYRPPRTTALMLAFSEHLRDNYSLATSDVENNTYYVDFPGYYDALLRPSGCSLLWLELRKHTRDFWLSNSWILASVVWCFSIRKHSKLEIKDVKVDSEATVIRWPKGHATKLTSFQESNSEIQTSCSDIAKSTMDITKIQKEEAKIVAWESQQKANCTIQGRKLVSDHCFHLVTGPDRRIFLPDGLLYDLREGDYEEFGHDSNRTIANGVDKEGPVLSKLGSSSTAELHPKNGAQGESKPTNMPPTSVMTRLILIMVWKKLIRNPNTYSSLIGLTWSLISFKFIPTYTNTGPSPRVDVNNNQLQQEEQDDLEVRVEK
ncbi:hypothetical protein S245_037233, partial [Arachis hypogaea]